ncbi:MAG: DUF2459 domain-containing protein [Candidatus Kapaibacterium sp.]
MKYILAILICLISLDAAKAGEKEFFIINYSWHTGFVLKNDYQLREITGIEADSIKYPYVDIGWGDQEFYQTPGFNLWLAAKAILFPTGSTVRMKWLRQSPDQQKEVYDHLVKAKAAGDQYKKLLSYISSSYKRKKGRAIIERGSEQSSVQFFKSVQYYWLLMTCNTWIAEALWYAGYDIVTDFVITEECLFKALDISDLETVN